MRAFVSSSFFAVLWLLCAAAGCNAGRLVSSAGPLPSASPNDVPASTNANAVAATPLPDQVVLAHPQKSVPMASAFPAQPSSASGAWAPRDWSATSQKYFSSVFNTALSGNDLPLVAVGQSRMAIPSYVGGGLDISGGGEALAVLGSILGASLSGLDLRSTQGRNWLPFVDSYVSTANQQTIIVNNAGATGSGSAWYALFPAVMHAQIASLYADDGNQGLAAPMVANAQSWAQAANRMAGNFNHTSYDFNGNQPIDGAWQEPDMAIGIAYVATAAWMARTKTMRPCGGRRWAACMPCKAARAIRCTKCSLTSVL